MPLARSWSYTCRKFIRCGQTDHATMDSSDEAKKSALTSAISRFAVMPCQSDPMNTPKITAWAKRDQNNAGLRTVARHSRWSRIQTYQERALGGKMEGGRSSVHV